METSQKHHKRGRQPEGATPRSDGPPAQACRPSGQPGLPHGPQPPTGTASRTPPDPLPFTLGKLRPWAADTHRVARTPHPFCAHRAATPGNHPIAAGMAAGERLGPPGPQLCARGSQPEPPSACRGLGTGCLGAFPSCTGKMWSGQGPGGGAEDGAVRACRASSSAPHPQPTQGSRGGRVGSLSSGSPQDHSQTLTHPQPEQPQGRPLGCQQDWLLRPGARRVWAWRASPRLGSRLSQAPA